MKKFNFAIATIFILGIGAFVWLSFLIGDSHVIIVGLVGFLIFTCAVIYIYYDKINYKCEKCNKVFKPKFWSWLGAFHTPTKRKLHCPHCNEKCWCKETIDEIS